MPQMLRADIDTRPFLRDLFISECRTYEPVQWTDTIAQTVNLAQDFSFDDVLYGEPSTGHFRMRDRFRIYVEDVDNWTVDPVLAESIPQLKGQIRLR